MSKKHTTSLVTAALVFLFSAAAYADPDDKQSTLGCMPVLGCTDPTKIMQPLEITQPEFENRIAQ